MLWGGGGEGGVHLLSRGNGSLSGIGHPDPPASLCS